MNCKKYLFICMTFFSLAIINAQETNDSDIIKKFIKGNIEDKTTAIRGSSGDAAKVLSEKGLDFVLSYYNNLGADDKDLAELAVSSVFAVSDINQQIEKKIISIFSVYDNDNVRIAILDKLKTTKSIQSTTVETINKWLSEQESSKCKENDSQTAAIALLGKFGNSQSFTILFDCYNENLWPKHKDVVIQSIGLLVPQSLSEIADIISLNDSEKLQSISNLILNNTDLSAELKAQIAENILSEAIFIVDNTPDKTKDVIPLQVASLSVLAQNNWTRASELIQKNFNLASSEYDQKNMTEEDFISVIKSTGSFSSLEIANTLNTYLGDLNKQASAGNLPADDVILAIIKALGDLGDKASFDNLWLVTNMDYSDNVVSAARSALASLKW